MVGPSDETVWRIHSFWHQQWLVGDVHFHIKFRFKAVRTPLRKTASELCRIGSRPRAFQRAKEDTYPLSISLTEWWLKMQINCSSRKSATMFLCVKTFNNKLSINYSAMSNGAQLLAAALQPNIFVRSDPLHSKKRRNRHMSMCLKC